MPAVTYYVALPFIRDENGDLVGGEAQERPTAHAALRTAEAMAAKGAGAVAFSRTGDPNSGEFAPAVVLQSFGEVPDLADMLSEG